MVDRSAHAAGPSGLPPERGAVPSPVEATPRDAGEAPAPPPGEPTGTPPADEPPADGRHPPPRGRREFLVVALAALGVVYGDIGTSPLYALRECFAGEDRLPLGRDNVLGVLSLIVWSLVVVVTVKYLLLVMRADNRGEGGILALLALVRPAGAQGRRSTATLVALGLFGAALLYGDGMITPAISVLSAVEGLREATPAFTPYVVPITVVILVVLFSIQRRGTTGIGKIFGPVTLLWFVVLAVLGAAWIVRRPEVLLACDPRHAAAFFAREGAAGAIVLGAVFLVVTGGEALYADMGHFGKRPIRVAWFALVLPALLLNYFGQGALLLEQPESVSHPFYALAPAWALYPLVGLATAATIIASQAVISGAFSLTRQAIQLGYCPRLKVVQTSSREIGQIYIGPVNWLLLGATLWLVTEFRSSSALASAYGVAVSTTMVLTTILLYVAMRELWRWSLPLAVIVCGAFLAVDMAFLVANFSKVADGGWFPLLVAALAFTVMTTWRRGRSMLRERLRATSFPIELFLREFDRHEPLRVDGTAVFMNSNPVGTPSALMHNVLHNKVVHRRVVMLTLLAEEVPRVDPDERLEIEDLPHGFHRLVARYGFMEQPDVPELLEAAAAHGLAFEMKRTTFFLSRETLVPSERPDLGPGMATWRERLFAILSRNALGATTYFGIPPDRVVEIGTQVEL